MKIHHRAARRSGFLVRSFPILGLAATVLSAGVANAGTTVSTDAKFTWGENIGWMNWRDANAVTQGVRVHQSHLVGFVWCENVGWLNVGNGQPAGGVYANTDHTNFGVNVDPQTGVCSGLAWGENIGWVGFGTVSAVGVQGARYEVSTGRFRGFAWGENVGWINLDAGSASLCGLAADLNADGVVNTLDLTSFLGTFGVSANLGGKGDLNDDGAVNTLDLVVFLGQFGRSCG